VASGIDEIREPLRFALGHRLAFCGEAVVAAAVLVRLVVERNRQFLDQAVNEHALNRSIQRAGTEPGITVGETLDVLHDAVAVRFAVGERQQDVEDGRRQQRRRLLVGLRLLAFRRGCNHGGYMYRGAS